MGIGVLSLECKGCGQGVGERRTNPVSQSCYKNCVIVSLKFMPAALHFYPFSTCGASCMLFILQTLRGEHLSRAIGRLAGKVSAAQCMSMWRGVVSVE